MSAILNLTEIKERNLELVGGKAANLADLLHTGQQVPPAYVVTAEAFRQYVLGSGIRDKLREVFDRIDVDDTKSLHEASDTLRQLILETPMPDALRDGIKTHYDTLVKGAPDPYVAVRSSATAEDLPEASFAGQQETYLNIQGADDVVEHVQKCWASLYTPRALFYRAKHHFSDEKVSIAVVVQRMIDAEKAGVMFTKHPTTGADEMIVEAAWGLGEGVVSGSVSPDNYVLNPDGSLARDPRVANQSSMYVRGKDGKTEVQSVPADKRSTRVVSDDELVSLARLGRSVEDHYQTPQDIEWAIDKDGELYLLQSRPVTTIKKKRADQGGRAEKGKPILTGLGASPGIAGGRVALVEGLEELDKCQDGDILVTTMTTPDMVPAMRRAAGIITDEGGMTCHAAIVSRELGVPCVVGTKEGTKKLGDDQEVSLDGDSGNIYEGIIGGAAREEEATRAAAPVTAAAPAKPVTATGVKVNISMPEAIDRAVATDPDGVGLLRIEHIILGLGKHPLAYFEEGKREEYVSHLEQALASIVEPMGQRPVWIRTLDAPTDEFRGLEGARGEPHEPNPMLGWRGIRRGLQQPELLKAEFEAIKRVVAAGNKNVGVMIPLVHSPEEVREAKRVMREVGLEPHLDVEFGIMIEIPAAALIIDDILDEGLDFVSFGTNDLTQYTLAVDRNNEHVAYLYSEFHPAIGKLIEMVIKAASARGVETSICGQAGSNPKFVEKLINWGITSVSANIDAVPRVREAVARAEQRILLGKARRDA